MSKEKSDVIELNIGEKIRKLRKEERLTLQDISDLSGLSKPLLSQVGAPAMTHRRHTFIVRWRRDYAKNPWSRS